MVENRSDRPVKVRKGRKIAQLIFEKYYIPSKIVAVANILEAPVIYYILTN